MPNPRCAQRALVAMKAAYPGDLDTTDTDVVARDLLTDLRHFCATRALDFDRLIKQSKRHYAREAK